MRKSLSIVYDDSYRIKQIFAPKEQTGEIPTLQYKYDDWGNLTECRKLRDKTKSDPNEQYEILRYTYEDPQQNLAPSDHYITEILDPRGLKPIQYVYDDSGRLIATIDAKGNRIELGHDGIDPEYGKYEEVTDRNENKTRIFYNDRGNVLARCKYSSVFKILLFHKLISKISTVSNGLSVGFNRPAI